MRPARLTLLALSWVLPELVSCHGDGDPPGEPPSIGVGSAAGPISDWPEHGDGDQPPPPDLDDGEHPSAMDAGVDFGDGLPVRDAGGAQLPALDASAPTDPLVTASDAGEAPDADAGIVDAGVIDSREAGP